MCGLVGVYYFDRARPVDAERLRIQTETLVHRGPNEGGVYAGLGCGLGHRRLSIIDLSSGQQPMFSEDGRYVIAYNGEIYNYREVRAQLKSKGHRFSTDSDTQVFLRAFIEWGEDCTAHLNGMFACAIYDRSNHQLFLARDRMGKKPLYYYRDKERLIFASELKAILADPTVPKELDATAIADFFAFSCIGGSKSIFSQVRKLPAASSMMVRDGALHRRRYWDVDFSQPDEHTDLEKQAERLLELLTDATRLRLRADVPLGAFLSGGVDSSTTVALMAQLLERPVVSNSIGFDTKHADERQYARAIAERFSTDHHEKVVLPQASKIIHDLSWFYDEPFADSSAVPTYYLCEMTRAQVTVALSGDGGDELFAGYTRYPDALAANALRDAVPALVRQASAWPLRHLFSASRFHPRAQRAAARLYRAAHTPERAYYNHLSTQPWRYHDALSNDFIGALDGYDPFDVFRPHLERAARFDPLSKMQYLDLKTYLIDDILVKVDRASMAHALEVRVPMLDHRVVEAAAKIPPIHRIQEGQKKRVLLKAIAKLIPPDFFDRPKQGFGIPIFEWFRGALKRPAEQLFFDQKGGRSGVLDDGTLKRMWGEHQLKLVNHGTTFWNVMMFELWYQRFMEGAADSISPTATMKGAAPARRVYPPV